MLRLAFILGIALVGTTSATDWWEELDQGNWPAPKSPVHEVIDSRIAAGFGADPASRADEATLLRRLTLDLVGRIPTMAEQSWFAAEPAPSRWERWVDRLLVSPGYHRFLAHEWNWHLMDGSRTDFQTYLAARVEEEVRWDQIFADAVGGRADSETLKGADQFLRKRVRDLDQMANDVSVDFLGVNISCAQCHDHPDVESWTQETYYGMKAFFGRTFENGGFAAERAYGTISYKTTGGEERTAEPRFLGGTVGDEPVVEPLSEDQKKAERTLLEDCKKKKVAPPPPSYSRRDRFVEMGLSESYRIWLARALVNQTWDRLMGRGLVMPLDQMHGGNRPSHPALLQWLAEDLLAHDFDLRRLTRGIVLSQAYQRESRWNGEGDRPPADRFAVAPVGPLTPRQYAVSLKIAAADPNTFPIDQTGEAFEQRISSYERSGEGWASRFARPGAAFHVPVSEALDLSNNPQLDRDLLKNGLVPHLSRIEDPGTRIDLACRAILCRPATPEEVVTLAGFLEVRKERGVEPLEQVVWALLASTEARFNH